MKVEYKAERIYNSFNRTHPVLYIRGNENPNDFVVIAINSRGRDIDHNKCWDVFIYGRIDGCVYLCGNENICSPYDDAKFIDYVITMLNRFKKTFEAKGIEYHIDEVWKDFEWEEDLTIENKWWDSETLRLRKYKEQ